MRCPSCGHNQMVTKICDEILSYGGKSVILHNMKGNFCPECGEGVWDAESYRRYTEEQTQLASVGAVIRGIRKHLGMTQIRMAEIFGVGKMAFSRYERGETAPAPAFVKLLRIVDRHPELIAELQEPSPDEQLTTRTVCPATDPAQGPSPMNFNPSSKKGR
jgi:HTH-type transcriptional regulator / antitoxin MqsA